MIHENLFLQTNEEIDTSNATPVLLILNSDSITKDLIERLWNKCPIRVCADGGANRLYNAFQSDINKLKSYLPHFIKGDLDSIEPHVRAFYEEEGVRVLRDENQDNNDFEKCLEELKCYTDLKHCNNNAIIKENCMRYGEDLLACDKHVVSTSFGSNMVILAIGGFHNSLHHDMGNLHVLYKYMDIQSPVFHRMVLIGEKCLAELMSVAQGPKHNIQPIVGIEGPTCGLLPLRKPCQTVTTTGLKWDLSEHTLEFGDLISTSNEFTIPHDGPPLITMELSDTLLWTCDYVL